MEGLADGGGGLAFKGRGALDLLALQLGQEKLAHGGGFWDGEVAFAMQLLSALLYGWVVPKQGDSQPKAGRQGWPKSLSRTGGRERSRCCHLQSAAATAPECRWPSFTHQRARRRKGSAEGPLKACREVCCLVGWWGEIGSCRLPS
jgi:hypothetical protein